MPATRGLNYSLRDVFQMEVEMAYAELNTSISGNLLRQPAGDPVAGGPITLIDSATGEIVIAVSNTDGTFLVPAIAAGTYQAEVDGFVVDSPSEIVVGTEDLVDVPIARSRNLAAHPTEHAAGAPGKCCHTVSSWIEQRQPVNP